MPDLFETGDVDLKKLLNAEDKELIARIKSILGPFILRRLKSDVMTQLVPKIQMVCILFCLYFLFFIFFTIVISFFGLLMFRLCYSWACLESLTAFTCQTQYMTEEFLLQVRYVGMEKDQEDAYKEAIESYRAASLARVSKQHEISTNSAAVVFSRRQISNYFLEFRKVLKLLDLPEYLLSELQIFDQ